jgi:chromosome segregation ATPase
MSTTTVSYSATAAEVQLRELRRQEEQARAARRRRLGAAQETIAAHERVYAQLVDYLDNCRPSLPDLAFSLPSLPFAPSGDDPAAFEQYAATLASLLSQYGRQVTQAISNAEIALERRKQLAAAWQEIRANSDEIAALNQTCTALAKQLGRSHQAKTKKALPASASLEEAQSYLAKLRPLRGELQAQYGELQQLAQKWHEIERITAQSHAFRNDATVYAQRLGEAFIADTLQAPSKTAGLQEIQQFHDRLQANFSALQAQRNSLANRVRSRDRAAELTGDKIDAVSGSQRQTEFEAQQTATARAQAEQCISQALAAAQLQLTDLPSALQIQAAFAVEQAARYDTGRQVVDAINRFRVRSDNIVKAQQLLTQAPEYTDGTTAEMTERWNNLTNRLQSVICGHDEWTNSLELEHRQIHADCALAMRSAYAKAKVMADFSEVGFRFADGEDDLLIMNLSEYPEYDLVIEEQKDKEGGYMLKIELVADPELVDTSRDGAVTQSVCDKLQGVRTHTKAVASEVHVVERKPTVTRKRRPARKRQARKVQM